MNVFLVLSSLSVIFYALLLVALYRDSRSRRRNRVEVFEELEAGEGLRLTNARKATLEHSRPTPSEISWHPLTRVEWKPATRSNNRSDAAAMVSRNRAS